MFDKDMLKSILAAYGPSGREQTVSDVIRSALAQIGIITIAV